VRESLVALRRPSLLGSWAGAKRFGAGPAGRFNTRTRTSTSVMFRRVASAGHYIPVLAELHVRPGCERWHSRWTPAPDCTRREPAPAVDNAYYSQLPGISSNVWGTLHRCRSGRHLGVLGLAKPLALWRTMAPIFRPVCVSR